MFFIELRSLGGFLHWLASGFGLLVGLWWLVDCVVCAASVGDLMRPIHLSSVEADGGVGGLDQQEAQERGSLLAEMAEARARSAAVLCGEPAGVVGHLPGRGDGFPWAEPDERGRRGGRGDSD